MVMTTYQLGLRRHLQAKHEALSKSIVEQQEKLRKVSEELLRIPVLAVRDSARVKNLGGTGGEERRLKDGRLRVEFYNVLLTR